LLTEAGQIQTSTSGSGDAGVISIGAFELNFIAFTFVGQAVKQLTLTGRAQIASSALPGSRGDGGGILLSGTEVRLEDRARIEASTAGAGDAGGVLIGAFEIREEGVGRLHGAQGERLILTDGAQISTSALPGSRGDGGLVLLFASTIALDQQARIEAITAGTGNAGAIVLGDVARANAELRQHPDAGRAVGFRTGTVADVTLMGGAQITSSSTLPGATAGDAGDIRLRVTDTVFSRNGAITTEAVQANGGDIAVQSRLVHLVDSRLTAEARGTERTGSDGGNVTITADFVVLNSSQVLANAFGGNGGNITISAAEVFLASTDSRLDASSQLGLQGTIDIRSPVTEVSGVLAPLSPAFSRAAVLLRDRCAERLRQGTMSSFIVRGRDGIPVEPDGFLPSPLEPEDKGQGQLPQQHLQDYLPAKDAYAYRFAPGFLALECPR
jgi:hypothetical protein